MNAYESCCMQEITGETLRPGGFALTQKAINFCKLTREHNVLDLGCGRGASIEYLHKEYQIRAVGIDASKQLLQTAKAKNPYAQIIFAKADALPFFGGSFQAVFAECTLSLMDNLGEVLNEAYRVLRLNGWFIISDVYAKNPKALHKLKNFSLNSCLRGLHDLTLLQEELEKRGFEVLLLEDYSHFLKELMVKIIFSHGSMNSFWGKTMVEPNQLCCSFEENLRECKPGYFMVIARKRGDKNG